MKAGAMLRQIGSTDFLPGLILRSTGPAPLFPRSDAIAKLEAAQGVPGSER